MDKKWYSNHHICPKSREDEWYNVHHPDNQELLKHKSHEDLHRLFQNMLPHEQIKFLLEINQKVMTKTAVKKIEQVIYWSDFYLNHLYNDKRDRKRRRKAG